MFTQNKFSNRQIDESAARKFAIEELPTGAFTVVAAALSGMAFWSVGAGLLSVLHAEAPHVLGLLALLGIVLGVAGAIKLLFWLSDRAANTTLSNSR